MYVENNNSGEISNSNSYSTYNSLQFLQNV